MSADSAAVEARPPAGWLRGASAALVLTILYVAATAPLGSLPALVVPAHDHLLRGIVASAGMGVVAALILIVGFEVVFANRRRDLRPYGIARPRRPWSSLVMALGLYLPVLIVGFLISRLLGLGGTTTPDVHHESNGAKVAISFLVVVVAPWLEEVAVRGLLFSSLSLRFGFWAGAVASGLFWAGLHLVAAVLIPFTMFGVLLAYIRRRSGSVLPGIIVHGSQNTLAAALGTGAGWYMAPMPVLLLATIALTWRWLPADRDRVG